MQQPIRLDRVQPEPVVYLDSRQRIPKGMISVIAGKADQGKGLLAALIAAEASRQGIRVLYSAAEDSHSVMTRPRLEAAGAVQRNILLWRFKLPKQWEDVKALIIKQQIGLVVIDPLASHLSSGISRHSDNIRTVTDPMEELISQTKTAVVIIEHILKGRRHLDDPLNAIGGTGSGLVAAARAAYLMGTDPNDSDRRLMCCVKFNVRDKTQVKALAFEVDTVEQDVVGQVPLLVFDEEIKFDPMSMLVRQRGTIGRPADKRAAAAEWLTNYLALAGKPVRSKTIFEDAKQYNMSSKTLRRAAEDMEVVKKPPGGGPNVTWELPSHVLKLLGLLDEEEPTDLGVSAPDGDVDGEAPPMNPDDDWDRALGELLDNDDADEEDSDD